MIEIPAVGEFGKGPPTQLDDSSDRVELAKIGSDFGGLSRVVVRTFLTILGCVFWCLASFAQSSTNGVPPSGSKPSPAPRPTVVSFACIGDFGSDHQGNGLVAAYIQTWQPQFIITLGDNNYPSGSAATIDRNIGKHYHDYIFPYKGRFGRGAAGNRFFPSLGNHDWVASNAAPYLAYFELPGNERYYSFVRGPVELFCVDSDPHEPDGVSLNSRQADWLHAALSNSTSVWKIVYFHHAPYSSGFLHGSYTNETTFMRWPFKEWGATIVLSGHDHIYERLEVDGFPYIVNGLGGDSRDQFHLPPVEGSLKRYNDEVGVLRVDASIYAITFRFFTYHGKVVDTLILRSKLSPNAPNAPPRPAPGSSGPTNAVPPSGASPPAEPALPKNPS